MICCAAFARGRGRNRRSSRIVDAAGPSAFKLCNIFLGQTLRAVVLLAPEQFAQGAKRRTDSSAQTAVRFFWLLRGGLDIRIMQIYSSGAEHIPGGKNQGH